MGVASGRGYQEVGVASGWNLWVSLVSVVVRRYIIDILIINVFSFLLYIYSVITFGRQKCIAYNALRQKFSSLVLVTSLY